MKFIELFDILVMLVGWISDTGDSTRALLTQNGNFIWHLRIRLNKTLTHDHQWFERLVKLLQMREAYRF